MGTWSLDGQNVWCDSKPIYSKDEEFSYPAIIDTGSSQISVPPQVMEKIKAEWKKVEPNLQCTGSSCGWNGSCKKYMNILKPIGFQMNGRVFEIPATAYMWEDSDATFCYMMVHKNTLPKRL